MENLLDLANQDETQRPTEVGNEIHSAPEVTEEIDTAPKAQVAKELPRKPVTRPTQKREEPLPNPLLLDLYEWDVR